MRNLPQLNLFFDVKLPEEKLSHPLFARRRSHIAVLPEMQAAPAREKPPGSHKGG